MLGPWINGAAIAGGSLIGAALGKRIPDSLKTAMPLTFGTCALGIGVTLILRIGSTPPVVLAMLVGALIGELLRIETALGGLAVKARVLASRFHDAGEEPGAAGDFAERFVALMVLFSASGLGVFGAIDEGLGHGPTMLVAKAILDFFTAALFATTLGPSLCLGALPQIAVQGALFLGAGFLAPYMNPNASGNFSACGGLIMLATGLRICGIKNFPIANMLPALVLVIPFTALWRVLF